MTKDEAFSTERALKLALEVLEIQAYNSGDEKYTQAMTALKEALVQPEQEPVAWDGYNLYGICEAFDRVIEEHHQRKNPFHDPVNKDAMIALRVLRGFVPYMNLYTAPPAAQPAYRAVKTYHEGKPWYVAQPTQEKCRVCGEGEATLMVIRECNKCGSEYAGKAEFDLAKAQPEQALVYGTQVSKVWWDGEKLMAKPIPLEDFYEPAPVQEPEYCDPSSIIYKLAERVMSDCGHSTNDQRLLDRIADRIKRHIDAVTPIEAQPAVAEPHKQEPVQDSTCNETLRGHGKAYPRTCKKCGLGPCIGKPKFDDDPTQRKPLTGEQIEFAWMKVKHSTPGTALPIHEFARAIEAKLKELNT